MSSIHATGAAAHLYCQTRRHLCLANWGACDGRLESTVFPTTIPGSGLPCEAGHGRTHGRAPWCAWAQKGVGCGRGRVTWRSVVHMVRTVLPRVSGGHVQVLLLQDFLFFRVRSDGTIPRGDDTLPRLEQARQMIRQRQEELRVAQVVNAAHR